MLLATATQKSEESSLITQSHSSFSLRIHHPFHFIFQYILRFKTKPIMPSHRTTRLLRSSSSDFPGPFPIIAEPPHFSTSPPDAGHLCDPQLLRLLQTWNSLAMEHFRVLTQMPRSGPRCPNDAAAERPPEAPTISMPGKEVQKAFADLRA
jgi:hypothetical protein